MIHGAAALRRLDDLAEAALDRYGFARGASATRVAVSENATYQLDDGRGRRLALRFYRHGARDEAAIRSELGWIEALDAERVIRTAAPVPGIDGTPVQRFADGQLAAAFQWLDGHEPPVDVSLARRFQALGAIAARLHRHARSWQKPDGFRRPRWDLHTMIGPTALWGDYRNASGLDRGGHLALDRVADLIATALEKYGTATDRFGLVHGDLRLANLIASENGLAVIDFDDCGASWFSYDFAASASFLEHEPFLPSLRDSWCAGYRTIAPFDDEAILPIMVMLRRLLLTAWVGSHPEAEIAKRLGRGFVRGTVELAERFDTSSQAGGSLSQEAARSGMMGS